MLVNTRVVSEERIHESLISHKVGRQWTFPVQWFQVWKLLILTFFSDIHRRCYWSGHCTSLVSASLRVDSNHSTVHSIDRWLVSCCSITCFQDFFSEWLTKFQRHFRLSVSTGENMVKHWWRWENYNDEQRVLANGNQEQCGFDPSGHQHIFHIWVGLQIWSPTARGKHVYTPYLLWLFNISLIMLWPHGSMSHNHDGCHSWMRSEAERGNAAQIRCRYIYLKI